MQSNPQLLSLSSRIYHMLLHFYPARFRRDYGPQMVQLFRDCSLASLRDEGASGLLKLWPLMLFDLLKSAVVEHLQRGAEYGRVNRFRLSGWALIAGTLLLALMAQLDLLDPSTVRGLLFRVFGAPDIAWSYNLIRSIAQNFGVAVLFLGYFLLAVGVTGLLARYGERTGRFGAACLWLALLAIASAAVPLLLQPIAPGFIDDSGWIIIVLAPIFMLLFLALFGLAALRNKPFARGNGLPLLAGALPLVLTAEWVWIELIRGFGVYGFLGSLWVFAAWLSVVGLLYLGFVLATDVADEPTVNVVG